ASRAAEVGKPLALVCLDIDHFKSINDRYGHPAGDAVLRRIALLLEEQVRGNDLLARIGGEEFAVLAVDTDVGAAAQLGERLRAAVEAAGAISVGHASMTVTVSVGVAGFTIRPGDVLKAPERLLPAADDALYLAKRNGRNRGEVSAWAQARFSRRSYTMRPGHGGPHGWPGTGWRVHPGNPGPCTEPPCLRGHCCWRRSPRWRPNRCRRSTGLTSRSAITVPPTT